jgi:predicted GIY-YIG superfamily endonuclease
MCVLYKHYDSTGDLLYVGVSTNPFSRTKTHLRNSHWSRKISVITFEKFENKKEALEAEFKAITNENPKYNIIGKVNYTKSVHIKTAYDKLIEFYGTKEDIAIDLDLKVSEVKKWRNIGIPCNRALEVEKKTRGAITAMDVLRG